MPRHSAADDEWPADESDWDSESESPSEADDEPTIPCPACRKEIHEDAPQCPYCGHYVSDSEARSSPKPWWLIVAAVLAIFAVLRWIV